MALWERFLILLISTVIYKQKKLHRNKAKQSFRNQKFYSLLGQLWKVLIKIKQLKILMPVSLTPKN